MHTEPLNARSLFGIFRNSTKAEKRLLITVMLILIVRSVYYILNWDLQYDEMWSYNYFTSRPSYLTFFMYNNYPLYELSTAIFKWLPFEMKINLRLPVLIAGLITCLILYACLKAYFNSQRVAMAGMIGFAFSPIVNCYMLYGRGVMLEILFAIISFFSIAFWIRKPQRTDFLVIYSMATIGGFYAMPTHLYFWILLSVITMGTISGKKQSRYFFFANLTSIAGAFLCYLPIALGSGFSFITQIFQQRETYAFLFRSLPRYSGGVSVFLTGSPYLILLILILCIYLMATTKEKILRFALRLMIGLCFLPVMLTLIQQFYIPPRAVGYISLILPLLIGVLMYRFATKIRGAAYLSILAVLLTGGLLISHFHNSINWSRKADEESKIISQLLIQNHVQTCYDNSPGSPFEYFYPGIEYYYGQQNRNIQLQVHSTRSIRFKPFHIEDHYDCIVVNPDFRDPELNLRYNLLYQDKSGRYQIFVLKSVRS